MKTDTPETDAETWKAGDLRIGSKVCADFARKLERERDELKRWTSVNGVIDLQRERDEAREYADKLAEGLPDGMLPKDVEVLREANLGLATELATVTEQRDRLAAALQRIRDGYGGQVASPNCCEDCDYLLPIDEALQSLTHKP
jgi:hypothetical protein